ncbi:MAG: hypothetical protein AAGM22_29930 [Acidobacteriota bacterium]
MGQNPPPNFVHAPEASRTRHLLGRFHGRDLDVDLFGLPFPLPAGPATLARTAQLAILPAFVLREGRRHYRLIFRPPIRVDRGRDRDAGLEKATRAFVGDIEWAIGREPHRWFCFRAPWPQA